MDRKNMFVLSLALVLLCGGCGDDDDGGKKVIHFGNDSSDDFTGDNNVDNDTASDDDSTIFDDDNNTTVVVDNDSSDDDSLADDDDNDDTVVVPDDDNDDSIIVSDDDDDDDATCVPSEEICDGLDNNCDGEADENPETNASCQNGSFCDGEEICRSGECQKGESVNCSGLNGQCVSGVCSNEEQKCLEVAANEGNYCDADSDGCTAGDICELGECLAGTPADCSGISDECNDGICRSITASEFVCEKQAKEDGAECDDGNFCTQTDSCQAGVCQGNNPVVCTALDQCHDAGICDSATGICSNPNKQNGNQCDDGLFCTDGDICQNGTCQAGPERDCSASGNGCWNGVCNEATGSCGVSPKSAGTPCGDNSSLQCDNPDTCDGAGNCQMNFVSLGTPCDDGRFCTVSNVCNGFGLCNDGTPRNCDDGLFCTGTEWCNENSGTCVHTGNHCPETDCYHCNEANDTCNDPSGTSCNDGYYCTISDVCDGGGNCHGAPRDCSAFADECNYGQCDEMGDTCYSLPVNNGGTCDDGIECTSSSICESGSCNGLADKDSDSDTYIDAQCSGNDCNDADPNIHPGVADMVGNDIDENCDGVDGVDADHDTYASISSGGTDCDDNDATVYLGAPEICDAKDNDCDGDHDEGFFPDNDGDTYPECSDCNDTDPNIHPGATDRLNLADENCDGFDGESEQASSWSAKYLSIKLDSANKAHIIGGSGYHNNVSGVWQDELIDSNGGEDGSLAIDSLDNIHVSYKGIDGIRYATNESGSWVITTVETGGDCSNSWGHTAIGVDFNDDVHIVYGCNNSSIAYLKHATNQSGSWQSERVYGPIGVDARDISMVILSDDTMAVSWWQEPNTLQVSGGSWGSWSTTNRGNTSGFTGIARDGSDNLFVSHWFFTGVLETGDRLRLASDNPAWSWDTLVTDGGLSNSIAVTSDGRSHIFYVDRWADPEPLVKYITNDPNMTGDPTGSTWGSSVVGIAHSSSIWDLITSITLDSTGKPHAAYYGAGTNCFGLCYVR